MVAVSVGEDDMRLGLEERDGEKDAAKMDGIGDTVGNQRVARVDDSHGLCVMGISWSSNPSQWDVKKDIPDLEGKVIIVTGGK